MVRDSQRDSLFACVEFLLHRSAHRRGVCRSSQRSPMESGSGGWYTHRLWRVPLLWVLHLGYGWIVVGFVLKTDVLLSAVIPPQFTVHAFSLGGYRRADPGHDGAGLFRAYG